MQKVSDSNIAKSRHCSCTGSILRYLKMALSAQKKPILHHICVYVIITQAKLLQKANVRIAIVGAGLSGLACCYHLQKNSSANITLFDHNGVAGGASGIAAGLIHPYQGPKLKLNFMGFEAEQEAKLLFEKASTSELQRGILRPAMTDEQMEHFSALSQKEKENEWLKESEALQKAPFLTPRPALFIPRGQAICTKTYLENLWKVCEKKGAKLFIQKIEDRSALQEFDKIIYATGAYINDLIKEKPLPISRLKGQTLELFLPEQFEVTPFAIHASTYLVFSQKRCMVGATFERKFLDYLPTKEAELEIRKKLHEFAPSLSNLQLASHKAELRAYTQDKMPKIFKLSEKEWVMTALGSKGLLYHALVAKLLVSALLADDPSLIPAKFSSIESAS